MIEFWEYLDGRDRREFSLWRAGLQKSDRAILDEKMRVIEQMGLSVGCLNGPLRGHRHLYKIKARGPTAELRPLLCRGPQDNDSEVTMLKPMIEVGGKDQPAGARDEAERRRVEVQRDPSRRVRYEVPQP